MLDPGKKFRFWLDPALGKLYQTVLVCLVTTCSCFIPFSTSKCFSFRALHAREETQAGWRRHGIVRTARGLARARYSACAQSRATQWLMFFGCYPIFHFIVDYYCLFPIKKTGEPLVPPFFVTLCFLKILLNLEKFYLLKKFHYAAFKMVPIS